MESHSTITFNNPELMNIYINGKPLFDKYFIEQFDIHMTREENTQQHNQGILWCPSTYNTYEVILNIKPKEINEIDIPDITIEDLL